MPDCRMRPIITYGSVTLLLVDREIRRLVQVVDALPTQQIHELLLLFAGQTRRS